MIPVSRSRLFWVFSLAFLTAVCLRGEVEYVASVFEIDGKHVSIVASLVYLLPERERLKNEL